MTNAPPPAGRRLLWCEATITESIVETVSARSLVLDIPGWDGHLAGQNIDVRLTAEDGYQATRSYSLSSGPKEAPQITVERTDDGEVSPYLVDVVELGDALEVRGPIGGYFVWQPTDRPVVLIGGGSGLAPLRSMWRAGTLGNAPLLVAASARTEDRLIFADELTSLGATVHLTRGAAPLATSESAAPFVAGRIDETAITNLLDRADTRSDRPYRDDLAPKVFVCGPTDFVESMATHLLAAGVTSADLRLERFG